MSTLRLILALVAGMILSTAYDGGVLARFIPQASSLLSAAGVAPYRNCAAARAAGAAPVYRSDPGYAPWLDRDQDGIGCE